MYNNNDWEEDKQDLPVQLNSSKTKKLKIAGIIAAVVLVIVLLSRCVGGGSGESPTVVDEPSPPDSVDVVYEKDVEETQADVNETVEKSMFNVYMNTEIYFADGKSKGNFLIQNSNLNKRSVFIELYKEEGKELIYRSDVLAAGEKLDSDKLDKTLAKGIYPCIAYFNVLDQDTGVVDNRIGVKVNVIIGA